MTTHKQTIAFFGATGGTGATVLSKALEQGYHCTALVRTPDKLHTLLSKKYNLTPQTISTYLTIHRGNAKYAPDVAKALINPLDATHLVDTIWSSIGVYPVFQWSLTMPFILTDTTVCEDGMAAMFAAIDQLSDRGIKTSRNGQKPRLVVVSATADENLWQALPWVYVPFYAWLLKSPQMDKLKMERLVKADGGMHVASYVVIRPSIMTDGVGRGMDKVRAGWIWGGDGGAGREKQPGYTKGYTIGKRDLGAWVFKNVVVDGGWEGRCVSLCY